MASADSTGTPQPAEEGVDWQTKVRHFLNDDFVRSLPFWGIPFVIMGIAVYGGIGYTIAVSVSDYQGLGSPDFTSPDLEMYAEALSSEAFIQAAQNNLVLLIAFTTISLALGLFLAILLDQGYRQQGKVQTIYLLPMALSFVITAQLWLWMFNVNFGVINLVIGVFGLGPIDWLGNPQVSLTAVIFALIWQFSGYTTVVYLAGLRSLPDDQFEAAYVDGASTTRTYMRIIVPQMKAASVSAAVVLMLFALKAFTFLYALTGRYRPPNGTDILATLMVREAFRDAEWAYSAAIAVVLLAMALGVITPYLYYQYRKGSL
jgi:glucose/mannose transport system permease protein